MVSDVQSILLDKEYFTRDEAIRFVRNHGFYTSKIDETDRYYRFRQRDPERYSKLRTKQIKPGVKFIFGFFSF